MLEHDGKNFSTDSQCWSGRNSVTFTEVLASNGSQVQHWLVFVVYKRFPVRSLRTTMVRKYLKMLDFCAPKL